jgi:4-amino-4-deoxy-L-arabinose transferase-like glycosyltransferase
MPPARKAWSAWHTCAAALLLAIAAFVQFTVVLRTPQGKVYGDGLLYVFYAYNLKHHQTFSKVQTFGPGYRSEPIPDKLTLPGYPAFLSLFLDKAPAGDKLLQPEALKRAMLAQASLGVLSTLLAFLIGLRLLPLGYAFATGTLVAILPQLAVASTHLMTEPLFTTLVLASVLGVLSAARTEANIHHYMIAGLLVGVASMVRPQLQLVPLLVLVVVMAKRHLRPHLPKVVIATACFAAIVTPWFWRNAGVERPASDHDLFVTTLYHGSFPNFMYQDDPRTLGYPYYFDPAQARVTRDAPTIISHIASKFANEPGKFLRWYLLGKPVYFLAWTTVEGPGDIFVYPTAHSPYLDNAWFKAMRDVSFLLHWPLMLLAVTATLISLWRPRLLGPDSQKGPIVLLGALFAYLLILHSIGAPFPRYNIPFRPIAFILAVVLFRALVMAAQHHLANVASSSIPPK